MDCLMVHLIQAIMTFCLWDYIIYDKKNFHVKPAKSLDMMIARFVASMMMHIIVEKEVRAGLRMMKYTVNHHEKFTSVYPPFAIAFLLTIMALIIEVTVMVIFSSM